MVNRSRLVKWISGAVLMLFVGANSIAATDDASFSLYFANIKKSGSIDFTSQSGPYNFNYTKKSHKWSGKGTGKIKNLSKKAQSYKNKITYGIFQQNGLTQTASLYTVPAGSAPTATFTASGTY